jgi:hypothetical protein
LRKKSKQSTQVPFLTPNNLREKEKKKDCLCNRATNVLLLQYEY